MIERHFFRGRHLKTFDFNFGFCIPDSKNTWYVPGVAQGGRAVRLVEDKLLAFKFGICALL